MTSSLNAKLTDDFTVIGFNLRSFTPKPTKGDISPMWLIAWLYWKLINMSTVIKIHLSICQRPAARKAEDGNKSNQQCGYRDKIITFK